MSWDTERAKSGKKPWNWIEIEIQRCTHTWGDGVGTSPSTGCPAVLGTDADDKCYNSWETCPLTVRDSFNPATYWLRFCEPSVDIPRVFNFDDGSSPTEDGLPVFIPLLAKFTHDPSLPDPGESLGLRVRFTAQLQDAPHHDIGIDKYALERSSGAANVNGETFDPATRSTLLRKLKRRFPHYVGRRLRWYQGYITDSPQLGDFRKREYVMEKFVGPDSKGRLQITANDPLRLLADERSQVPMKSGGKLVAAIASGDTVTSIEVATDDQTEYDLKTGDTEDYVRIGDEIFTYTGVSTGSPGDTITLTGVTRAAPSPYTTVADDHSADDIVQRCRLLSGTVAAVVEEVMTDYGNIPAAYIPTADWTAESDTWASDTIQRLICEPEGCESVINEIIGQTLTWGFWWDEVTQEIKYQAVRPADVDDIIPTITDDANIIADSVQVADLADKIVNEVQVLFGQIDPTARKDDIDNYRQGVADINADSQSSNETGQRRIKKVWGLWHPVENVHVVEGFARRTVNAKSKNLIEMQFSLERKDEDVRTAGFIDLSTIYLIDSLGMPETKRMQVLQVKAAGELLSYRAREDFFRESYGRIASGGESPGDLDGLLWTDATDAQQTRYMFIAADDGNFSNGDRGKALA